MLRCPRGVSVGGCSYSTFGGSAVRSVVCSSVDNQRVGFEFGVDCGNRLRVRSGVAATTKRAFARRCSFSLEDFQSKQNICRFRGQRLIRSAAYRWQCFLTRVCSRQKRQTVTMFPYLVSYVKNVRKLSSVHERWADCWWISCFCYPTAKSMAMTCRSKAPGRARQPL